MGEVEQIGRRQGADWEVIVEEIAAGHVAFA